MPHLPVDLRLRILALLPPNDLALAGRLACRQAAHRFGRRPQDRTARLSQSLQGHAATATCCVEGARAAMKQLSLRQKLLTLSTAAASGCEANVEFAWQLLQPHVFPELLQTDHYHELVMRKRRNEWKAHVPNLGPAAVASGLAHLLPSLAQRCPGLVDPACTLEAAARHCDLAGLQAAWEVVGQRLLSSLQPGGEQPAPDQQAGEQRLWGRVMAAAAGSPGPDATAKMEWAVEKGRSSSSSGHVAAPDPEVWGAAAASGDLCRVRWLHEHGLGLNARDALKAALQHADLDTIQRLEEQGGYLPAAGESVWTDHCKELMRRAAAAARDSAAKLRWLAGRRGPGAFDTGTYRGAAWEAVQHGNLEALQLILQQWREHNSNADTAAAVAALPQDVVHIAAGSGSVPTLAWLCQAGCALGADCWLLAFNQGDLAMVRWLLEADCPRGSNCIWQAVGVWPSSSTPAESGRLEEAVRLLAAAGWPLGDGNEEVERAFMHATSHGHPWAVMHVLLELQQPAPYSALALGSFAGCEATLEALVGMGVLQGGMQGITAGQLAGMPLPWYVFAVRNGDRGTLECLRRLGVPLDRSAVVRAALEGPVPAPAPAVAWVEGQQQEPAGGSPAP